MLLQKYINNITALQLYQILRFGTMLLISIVFAKSNLTTEAIGNYELFMFVSVLVSSFWLNGLIQSLLPIYNKTDTIDLKKNKPPDLFNVFILISFISVLTILLLFVFHHPLSEALSDSSSMPYFHLIMVYLFFSNPSYLIEYIYLLRNKPASIIKYGLCSFAAQLILMSLPIILGYGLHISLYGLLIISFLRYCWLLFLLVKHARLTVELSFIKKHLHYAWPLMISSLIGGSAAYVDGFLVLNKFDSATFAIFRYGAKEFPIVLLMANALSTAMIPEFSDKQKLSSVLENLKRKSQNIMHLLFPVTIIFLICSEWLYPILFSAEFTDSAAIFNIYLLLIISRLIFPHTIIIGFKKMHIIMLASFAELIINITLSIILINIWGIKGIAFATILAYMVQKLIWLIYTHHVLNISPKKYIPLKTFAVYSLLTIIIFSIIM